MRYLRTITAAIIIFVFVASLAVGIGFIFAVKNVNVTLYSYSYQSEEEGSGALSSCKEYLEDRYRGSLIGFVSQGDIEEDLDGALSGEEYLCGSYKVVSFEREYPCTINVEIEERRETYVWKSGSLYNVYDDEGHLLRTAASESEALNVVAGEASPNTYLYLEDETFVTAAANLGSSFCEIFRSDSVRSALESVEIVTSNAAMASDDSIFTLRSGLKVEIYDCYEDFDLKAEAAYSLFSTLAGNDKIFGTIYAAEGTDGAIHATVSR